MHYSAILSSANWKFFVALSWNQIYWDFITCKIELVRRNNERIYWKDRPHNASPNFPYILYSFLKIKLTIRFPWQKSPIYWELYFPTQHLHYGNIYLIHSWLDDIGSFTCDLPNDILKGTFKFSRVMMRLNWSLPRIHSTKLIDYKYANTFFSLLVDI